jgi:tRNA(Ile)-lysidine synthase
MGETLASRVRTAIRRQTLIRAGDRVGVAVSGGADSVALLLLLLELRGELGIALSIAHFNHKLRGRASDADEKFVAKLAAKRQLAFLVGRTDVAARAKGEKANLEDTARRARYEFFESLVTHGHASRIAVAHTADDQAETVLAHILRGTGLAGLGGIHPVAGNVVRPLLEIRRADLRAYLRAKKQSWREDATNSDTGRTRARIRSKLIPLLEKQFQPEAVRHLVGLAELARMDEAFLDALTEQRFAQLTERNAVGVRLSIRELLGRGEKEFTKAMTRTSDGIATDDNIFARRTTNLRISSTEGAEDTERNRAEKNALTKRLVRRIVREVKSAAGQLNAGHVNAVLDLAENGQSGKVLQLSGGVEVRRELDALFFCPRHGKKTKADAKSTVQFEHELQISNLPAAIRVPELSCVFRFRVIDWPAKRGQTSYRDSVLDRDALRFPVVLRSWRPGDKLQPLGHQRAHKLKRLLNKERVSRWEREGWPVLTSGGFLAWARGFPVAAEFAPGEKTRAGIVIAEEKNS